MGMKKLFNVFIAFGLVSLSLALKAEGDIQDIAVPVVDNNNQNVIETVSQEEAKIGKTEPEPVKAEDLKSEPEMPKVQATPKAESEKIVAKDTEKASPVPLEKEKLSPYDQERGAPQVTTEYAVDPGSVQLMVELDPGNYGMPTRNFRTGITAEFDFLFKGRSGLRFEYRPLSFLSTGLLFGFDWTDMSVFNRFRRTQSPQTPWQMAVLGGLAVKLRLTEWYMQSAISFEPSILTGYMWQVLGNTKTKHLSLRPGAALVFDRVFDSGFIFTSKVGVEFPFDFLEVNPIKEIAEPVVAIGFGLAI